MTATAILDTLAKEFSTRPEQIASVLQMLDAGLAAPYVGRVRRADTGNLRETMVRRLDRRRRELEELDRRRATILRLLENTEGVGAKTLDEIRGCMDRFELEDLFLPHRRPEPEVQLAMDRGLGALADEFVKPSARSKPAANEGAEAKIESTTEASEASEAAQVAAQPEPDTVPAGDAVAEAAETVEPQTETQASEPASAESAPDAEAPAGAAPDPAGAAPEAETASSAEAKPADTPAPSGEPSAPEGSAASSPPKASGPTTEVQADVHGKVEITPQVALLCASAVSPDRGVHTEEEALSGAMRILSDRLGRDPKVRSAVRKMMHKHGVLSVRATVPENRLGRHRALLKAGQPLRQLQGHRLLSIRQAQKERVLTTAIELDIEKALPRVRAALGKRTNPDFEGVLEAVSRNALVHRLLPMLEEDVRLELKERADQEALRFLAQHLRQILLSPFGGNRPVAGIDANAKGDWTVVVIDSDGKRISEEVRIEVGEKRAADLGVELSKTIGESGVRSLAVGHGKHAREAVLKLRQAIAALGAEAAVLIVTESGLSSYANSELARQELPGLTVPGRMATSPARRLQDPMLEILKVEPRHLGLGAEQGLVSKANLRRVLRETVESCAAHVGCDVNRAPLALLRHLPGIGVELGRKLIERREQTPFASREDLRSCGILDESQWSSSVAFLRVPNSSEPLDRTSLHPDQYRDARRIVEACGGSVDEVLGRRGATKGMRRADFGIDEDTWRDLMREISTPGRDPRLRVQVPRLQEPGAKAEDLTQGQEVEGILSNVASFGAFVDIGVAKEGMIHISEISDRYVRDARELLSIGQVVRARVLDPSGQRVSLSLNKVADPFMRFRGSPGSGHGGGGGGRSGGRSGSQGGGGGGGRSRGRGGRDDGGSREIWPKTSANVRAAQSRRDGMAGAGGGRSGGGGGRKGGGGQGGGRPRPGGGRPGGRGRRDEERADPKVLAQSKKVPAYNPFASFFKADSPEESQAAAPDPKPISPESTTASEPNQEGLPQQDPS